MIRTILVDDEVHCLSALSLLLKEYCPDIAIVDKCRSSADGLSSIHKFKPELIFLDIEMPGMNGFELLEHFTQISFAIIFTTGYDQYAIKAIRFSALDYLLKPIDPVELVNAVKKVAEQRRLPSAEQFRMLVTQIQNKEHRFNKIAIPTTEGYDLILASEVVRCEAADNYTHLFLKNRTKLTACRTLKEIEEQLRDFNFFLRVHHSFIVNLNEVSKYIRGEGGYLIMSDNSTINVSRSRKEALLKLF